MQLSDLTSYAKDRYHIHAERKIESFSDFTVLVHPATKKWLAVLIRQWDPESGEEKEFCDIRCPRFFSRFYDLPYLTDPCQMSGSGWTGVQMRPETDYYIICTLFDEACTRQEAQSYTVVLDHSDQAKESIYQETEISNPSNSASSNSRPEETSAQEQKIIEMQNLYEYRSYTYEQECRNFVRQGQFMADFEDDSDIRVHFRMNRPTYHDLSLRQLRNYFSWRTRIRKGIYEQISPSYAVLYIFELLNQIGCSDPSDALKKLETFEHGYIDPFADRSLKSNLMKWKYDFSILNELPSDLCRQYQDETERRYDYRFSVLIDPSSHSDDEIFESLIQLGGYNLEKSALFASLPDETRNWFVRIWKNGQEQFKVDGRSLFDYCFNQFSMKRWDPLSGTVCPLPRDKTLEMNGRTLLLKPCREYSRYFDSWNEKVIQIPKARDNRLRKLLHEAERQLRTYLKVGRPLKKNADEQWISPFISSLIEKDRSEKQEASRKKVEIRFEELNRIRANADQTCQSLLVEEELSENDFSVLARSGLSKFSEPQTPTSAESQKSSTAEKNQDSQEPETVFIDFTLRDHQFSQSEPDSLSEKSESDSKRFSELPSSASYETDPLPDLSEFRWELLKAIAAGDSVCALLAQNHLMPEIEADALNEALFDFVGDNAVECTGNDIEAVEDYLEDINEIIQEGGIL